MDLPPPPAPPSTVTVWVGTYTEGESRGIYHFEFDPTHGALTAKGLVAETSNPSFFSIREDGRLVYVVNENEAGEVSILRWDDGSQQFDAVSRHPCGGGIPCHTELNATETTLAVSNYRTGNFSIFDLGENGEIISEPRVIQHEGSGPSRPHQYSPRGHCMRFSPNGKFVYAADMGIDQIISYPVEANGQIGPAVSRFDLNPGDGPRHFTFHPVRDLAFVVNQLSGSVVSARVDHTTGAWTRIDHQSTLPDGFSDENASADIHISGDGRFLYASNRGHDSIAIFEVAESGQLRRVGIEPTRGVWPRNFALSPDERFLLAANQKSDTITVFAVDPQTGGLTYTGHRIPIANPVCLKFRVVENAEPAAH